LIAKYDGGMREPEYRTAERRKWRFEVEVWDLARGNGATFEFFREIVQVVILQAWRNE